MRGPGAGSEATVRGEATVSVGLGVQSRGEARGATPAVAVAAGAGWHDEGAMCVVWAGGRRGHRGTGEAWLRT